MRTATVPLLLSLAPSLASAGTQAGAQPPKPSVEAQERLEELAVEVDLFVQDWRKSMQDKAKEGSQAIAMRPDFTVFVDRLLAWADESGGEDAALYLTQVVQLDGLAKESKGVECLDRLLRDHPRSSSWARLGRYLTTLERSVGEERKDEILEVLGKSPDADVRGWVALARHSKTVESAPRDSQEYAAARKALLAAAAEVRDATLRDELEGPIDLREKLGVGAQAPDIEGVDLDGVAFKLSEYKGKVVFLDFWGDW